MTGAIYVRPGKLSAVGILAIGWALVAATEISAQQPMGDAGARSSWTSDRHELREGDLVTIFVDESTLATANHVDTRTQGRSRELGLSGSADGTAAGGAVQSRADLRDRTHGESSRRERFATEVSAQVVEVGANGIVRVEGRKRVRIDGHEQVISLAGWLRPTDISGVNTVESWRLADAQVEYESSGNMRRQRGLIGRLVGWLWP
jgi:flagellar L-ring protein FlgH